MSPYQDYLNYRYDEGQRARIVGQSEKTDPDFANLIFAALQDYDEGVQDAALKKYLDCDAGQKAQIVSVPSLQYWIQSMQCDQNVLAIRLLPGRNDVDKEIILSLFSREEHEIRQATTDYFCALDQAQQEQLFSIEILIGKCQESLLDTQERLMWARMLQACNPQDDEAKKAVLDVAIECLSDSSDLDDIIPIIETEGATISRELAEKIARLCNQLDHRDGDMYEKALSAIHKHLDPAVINEETLARWFVVTGEEHSALMEVAILLILDSFLPNLPESLSYRNLWYYMYQVSQNIVNFYNNDDEKRRFNEALTLYKCLQLPQQQDVAPVQDDDYCDSISYRVDEGAAYQYMIAHLCFGRDDLLEEQYVLRKIMRNLRERYYNIYRESLDSIYSSHLRKCTGIYDIQSYDATRGKTEITEAATVIRDLISIENSILKECSWGNDDDPTKNVLKAVFSNVNLPFDVVSDVLDEAFIGIDTIFGLSLIDPQREVDLAFQFISDGKCTKNVISVLRNNVSLSQITDEMVEKISKGVCLEAAIFAIDLIDSTPRSTDLRTEVICNVLSYTHTHDDGDIAKRILELVLKDKDLRQTNEILWAFIARVYSSEEETT